VNRGLPVLDKARALDPSRVGSRDENGVVSVSVGHGSKELQREKWSEHPHLSFLTLAPLSARAKHQKFAEYIVTHLSFFAGPQIER